MKRADLVSRLERLEHQMIDAAQVRIAQLSDADRTLYEQWRQDCKSWHAQFDDPSDAYEALLNGDEPPRLPHHVERLLFDVPEITEYDSETDAERKYREFMERGR